VKSNFCPRTTYSPYYNMQRNTHKKSLLGKSNWFHQDVPHWHILYLPSRQTLHSYLTAFVLHCPSNEIKQIVI